MTAGIDSAEAPETGKRHDAMVVLAASLGTIFEWYDFFIYGTLAALFGTLFFPGEGPTGFLLALATFGVGFLVRPLGAALFGHLGDMLGRKYTFLVTISLMGVATAAVGLLPTYASIGIAAPMLLVLCRLVQGLALGGEYGGAAIYVAEHAPAGKRGFYTGFIQASATAGFLLSLVVVLGISSLLGEEAWLAWGWRIPFLLSVLLLGLSLIVRIKLRESPAFQALKDSGQTSRNPLRESFSDWARVRTMVLVLFGIAAGLTVIWYTAQFHALYFLQANLAVDEYSARLIVGAGAVSGLFWPVFFGWLSDRVGRKRLIVIGYALTLVLIFPLFYLLGQAISAPMGEAGGKIIPSSAGFWKAVLAIVALCALSGMTNGPVGALLVELFPTRLRYTSISIPYHIGSGYFGGFLPLISQAIVVRTGDPLSGIWYLIAVIAGALVITLLWLKEPVREGIQ